MTDTDLDAILFLIGAYLSIVIGVAVACFVNEFVPFFKLP